MVAIVVMTILGLLLGPQPACSGDPPASPPLGKRCRWVEGGTLHRWGDTYVPNLLSRPVWTMTRRGKTTNASCQHINGTRHNKLASNIINTSSPVNVSEDVSAGVGLIKLTTPKRGFVCETPLLCREIQSRDRTHYLYQFHNSKTSGIMGCNTVKDFKGFHNMVMWCSLGKKTGARFKRKRLKRSADTRPELVYTFIEQAVQPGAQVALKCSAVGDPPPRFRWTLDGQSIPTHHGAMVTEGRESGPTGLGSSNNYVLSTLSLSGARVEHGGRYECRATNSHGSVAHAARLNVYGSPYIRAMNLVKAVAGSDVTIWCPYYGFPIKSVKWEGGAGADPRYQQLDGQLTISNVDRDRDRGAWTCSVLTPGGELAKREVQVSVVSPPVISPLVFPPGLRAGDRAQLTCSVTSGDMPVYFSWLKDQMPISSILQVDERGAEFYSMLIFKSLTAAHSGVYTCVVTNTAGKANTSAELAIKVPPYWQIEPSDAAVLLNGSLTVSCEARGHPTPAIYWTKFSGSAETTQLGGVSDPVVLSNGSLRLEAARAEHSGKYRCRADNGVAPALSKTLTIHVNEPARFETPSANVTAKLGETIRLVCVARGDSPLSTAWSHSGRALPNSDYRMSISETRSAEGLRSELMIERADRRDSGVYRCQASNPFGRSDHFVHLAVQEPPEPPSNFRVVETTSRSVRLQWRRPYDGNSPVLGYVLQYRRHDASGADSWRDADTHNVSVSAYPMESYNTETEEATISSLEPATAYLVRARTVTAQFASVHTRALLALTLHEPPARAPISLRASAPRPSTIELAWQAPPSSSWNGELLGYTVWWWPSADGSLSGGANVGMEFATVRGLINKYTIEGLEHYTRYSVSVRAFNSAGAGPATSPVNTLTQESVPLEGPRAVRCRAVSPQSMKVEWSPPPAHAHHGALLGYKLLYRPQHNWLEWEVRGGGSTGTGLGAEVKRVAGVETLLLALRPHTNYTVQALAYTAAGDGVPAHSIHCTTQQDVPGPPAAVKVVATSVTSLAVSWLPPSRANGPILYYTIFYRELGRERPPQTTTVQAENGDALVGLGGSTELRSLSEGATYEAWVAAHSAAGEGEPSAPQPATTTPRAGARLLSFGVWTRVRCGHSLRLACVSRGEPAPRSRWLRGDRAVTHDPRTHLTPHGHLAIYEVDASTSGNYTCSARNAFGSEEVTYRVECAAPPSAPALNLDHASHKEAKLTWRITHHPAAPPHGFTIWWVRVRDDSGEGIEPASTRGEEERRLEAGGEAASVVLRALSCGVTYSVRAVAHSRAGPSPPSVPLLVRTKPPVLVWEGGGEPDNQEEGAEAAVWSNSSALAVDARRAVRCGARLVRLQWRRADAGGAATWREADLTSLHHHREVVISGLTAGAWYSLRLWTATESSRHQAILYAATTTHSGERLRRPVAFQSEGGQVITTGNTSDDEHVLGAVSVAFAALAALAVTALLLVLLAKRSTLFPCSGPPDDETRRCSHSAASTDKSVCPEQQNMRNCQHDYKHDKLSPASDVYEISPYATFAVGGETTAATLDHTLQFRTFGHRDNDAPPHRPCRKHPQRHRDRADVEKHHSDCELQQLSRYEKVRPRHCAGTSYCVPLAHHAGAGEVVRAVSPRCTRGTPAQSPALGRCPRVPTTNTASAVQPVHKLEYRTRFIENKNVDKPECSPASFKNSTYTTMY
ncbi:cell adhesion molecule Dscam2-like isoform X2 [Plodia interpunctella]|uniref:cell adhesion molecule Dscam2-like isoform X2 n=1 Tax=Plodia interpunctella TaxID=58824 RepID=UPI0023685D7A|nr:cell adhesion molecule DSCAML1-like isoform X2 [Plodia interpunctella]